MSRRPRTGRPALPLLAAVCAVGLSGTGCASFPTGGSVNTKPDQDGKRSFDDPYVRIIPTKPQDGWGPEKVVQGFLKAMANFDDGQVLLNSYLAPGVTWDSNLHQVQVVDDPKDDLAYNTTESKDTAVVKVTGNLLGKITSAGSYEAKDGKATPYTFTLKQVAAGRWRIVDKPNDLLLRRSAVDRAFRTTNLYFFAPDHKVLVPSSVFLPLVNRASLPTQLVKALLDRASLPGPSVQTSLPPKTTLRGDGIEISDDGTATVDLSKEAASGSVREMSAQLMLTLQQVTEIQNLRLKIDGRIRKTADGQEIQTRASFAELNPDGPPSGLTGDSFLLNRDGKLVQLSVPDQPFPVLQDRKIEHPAVSLDLQLFAGVSGKAIVVGRRGTVTSTEVMKVSDQKNSLLRPSWDRHNNLWIVETGPAGSRLWLWREAAPEAVEVQGWGFGGSHVRALRVARDGVRVAALIDGSGPKTEIQLGRITPEENGAPTMGEFKPINAELAEVRDLAWLDADTLAVLGRSTDTDTETYIPYQVPISGGAVRYIAGSISGKPMTIAATSGSKKEILLGVVSKDGMEILQRLPGDDPQYSEWKSAGAGAEPVYPG
ncbi:LpqB family beta-propeller domain-containing protein [Actinocorallia longicatena]|uniref:LpqB family beta-propeller domain-containing protein n=1 Tax=Actinocorallia longicatena TaxID=111803 RepID=A0ABP6QPK6_9ACTN